MLQGWTPLHSAVSAGHEAIVERLISLDAAVNAQNSGGQSPLHYAVSRPNMHPIWRTAPCGCAFQKTCLLSTQASKGRPLIVQLLLKHGGVVDLADRTGEPGICRWTCTGIPLPKRAGIDDWMTGAGSTPLHR
jgi:Ankyrin repeats (many copies)